MPFGKLEMCAGGKADEDCRMCRTVGMPALEQQQQRRRHGASDFNDNAARHCRHRQVADRMAVRGQFGKALQCGLVICDFTRRNAVRQPVEAARWDLHRS